MVDTDTNLTMMVVTGGLGTSDQYNLDSTEILINGQWDEGKCSMFIDYLCNLQTSIIPKQSASPTGILTRKVKKFKTKASSVFNLLRQSEFHQRIRQLLNYSKISDWKSSFI